MITNLGSSTPTSSSEKKGFVLNQANLESMTISVGKLPVTVNVWGLTGTDSVVLYRVRNGQLGNIGFESGDCCEPVTPPSPVVLVSKKPYVDCGEHVVITALNSEYTIDKSGSFICVYSGSTQCEIELIENRVSIQNRLCGC